MSDDALRAAERAFRASNTPEDEARWLTERVRAGALDAARLRLAAALGHQASLLALDDPPGGPEAWRRAAAEVGREATVRAALALVRALKRSLDHAGDGALELDEIVDSVERWLQTADGGQPLAHGERSGYDDPDPFGGGRVHAAIDAARCLARLTGTPDEPKPLLIGLEDVIACAEDTGRSSSTLQEAVAPELLRWALGSDDPLARWEADAETAIAAWRTRWEEALPEEREAKAVASAVLAWGEEPLPARAKLRKTRAWVSAQLERGVHGSVLDAPKSAERQKLAASLSAELVRNQSARKITSLKRRLAIANALDAGWMLAQERGRVMRADYLAQVCGWCEVARGASAQACVDAAQTSPARPRLVQPDAPPDARALAQLDVEVVDPTPPARSTDDVLAQAGADAQALLQRILDGELTRERLEVAVWLGDPTARAAYEAGGGALPDPGETPAAWVAGLQPFRWDWALRHEALARVALAAAGLGFGADDPETLAEAEAGIADPARAKAARARAAALREEARRLARDGQPDTLPACQALVLDACGSRRFTPERLAELLARVGADTGSPWPELLERLRPAPLAWALET